MLEILFYTTLTCAQADTIMFRMRTNENIPPEFKVELIEVMKESTPECHPWDAND